MDRRLPRDSAYEEIKACHRQARISGMSAFVIGSAATYALLKFTKILEKRSKYVPLVCLGVGACCGYVKSILVIQEYQNMGQKFEASKKANNKHSNQSTTSSGTQSKYGDEGFFTDDKGSK